MIFGKIHLRLILSIYSTVCPRSLVHLKHILLCTFYKSKIYFDKLLLSLGHPLARKTEFSPFAWSSNPAWQMEKSVQSSKNK